jgi:hypothetical protein
MNAAAVVAYDTGRALFLLWMLYALARPSGKTRKSRVLTVCAIIAYAVCTLVTYQMPYDFKRFWQVGRDLTTGADYYALDPAGQRQLILNPPTILPLFQIWALVPLRASAAVWTFLNAVGAFGLVPLAYHALRRHETTGARLPRPMLGLLATALAISCSNGMGLALGQVSMLAVAAIVLALWAQASQRPWLAGLALAAATIKVNTMLPFLALFLRKRDVPTWLGLGSASLGLCLLTGPIADLPRRCTTTLQTIRATFEPGRVNDYSDLGDSHASLVGLDQALYRLGLRDRDTIADVQIVVLALVLAALAWHVRKSNVPRGASCAMASLVAGIFFYHRVYDELILVLPILYGAIRSRSEPIPDRSRAWYAVAALALLVLFVSPDGLRLIHTQTSLLGMIGTLVRAAFLPLGAWLIVAALAIAWRATSLRPVATERSEFADAKIDIALRSRSARLRVGAQATTPGPGAILSKSARGSLAP